MSQNQQQLLYEDSIVYYNTIFVKIINKYTDETGVIITAKITDTG